VVFSRKRTQTLPMLRGLSLDFGGTLGGERPARWEIYAEEAQRAGLRLGADEVMARMVAAHAELPQEVDGAFRYTPEWFAHFIPRVLPLEELAGPPREALIERLFARFADPSTYRLLPGARELLELAQELGLRLALVSNWGPGLPRTLKALGVLDRFDVVLVSALERIEKPDPRLFARALEGLGLGADEVLHVGDHPDKDARGAQSAGLRTALVDGSGTMGSLEGTLRLQDLHQLARLLPSLCRP
jgi:putative hydrolase of the HAD superfamily